MQIPFVLASLTHNLADEFLAEKVARQTLGWPPREVRMAQPALQDGLKTAALHGMLAAGIKVLATAGNLTN